MDIEWAKDGDGVNVGTGKLFIVQARPETVHSQSRQERHGDLQASWKRARLLAKGLAVGAKIGQGTANVISDVKDIHCLQEG